MHSLRVQNAPITQHSEIPWKFHRSQVVIQMDFFKAEAVYALTTVFAGFAAQATSLPNMTRTPALVAGLTFVLIMDTFGRVNLAIRFTSDTAISAMSARTARTCFGFSSQDSLRVFTISVLVIGFLALFPC